MSYSKKRLDADAMAMREKKLTRSGHARLAQVTSSVFKNKRRDLSPSNSLPPIVFFSFAFVLSFTRHIVFFGRNIFRGIKEQSWQKSIFADAYRPFGPIIFLTSLAAPIG